MVARCYFLNSSSPSTGIFGLEKPMAVTAQQLLLILIPANADQVAGFYWACLKYRNEPIPDCCHPAHRCLYSAGRA